MFLEQGLMRGTPMCVWVSYRSLYFYHLLLSYNGGRVKIRWFPYMLKMHQNVASYNEANEHSYT